MATRPSTSRARQARASAAVAPNGALPALAQPLLAWFAHARRALPWREEPRDPYRTWVSEVMLQQTRVEVVLPYYERFCARFPTLSALAAAGRDEVLALWSGLGYYARARNLHRAAQAAAALPGGALPQTAAALRALPGFGPYTAAAVASLAFGEDAALVDGNVARVLGRVLRLPGDAAAVRARAWELAPALLPRGAAGPFNEALMELGATVCTPRAPRCDRCPLAQHCGARAAGDAEAIPAAKARAARPRLRWAAVAVLRDDGAVLLARRAPGELFEGLWDLPSADAGTSARAAARAVLGSLGLAGRLSASGTVEQTLTHRELAVSLFVARAPVGTAPREGGRELRWAGPAALGTLGLSSLAAKSLRACGLSAPARPVRR